MQKYSKYIFWGLLALSIFWAAITGFGAGRGHAANQFILWAWILPISLMLVYKFYKKFAILLLVPLIPVAFMIYYNKQDSKEMATQDRNYCISVFARPAPDPSNPRFDELNTNYKSDLQYCNQKFPNGIK